MSLKIVSVSLCLSLLYIYTVLFTENWGLISYTFVMTDLEFYQSCLTEPKLECRDSNISNSQKLCWNLRFVSPKETMSMPVLLCTLSIWYLIAHPSDHQCYRKSLWKSCQQQETLFKIFLRYFFPHMTAMFTVHSVIFSSMERNNSDSDFFIVMHTLHPRWTAEWNYIALGQQ